MSSAVFSDSWFRIAQARVALPASTKVERQNFGGELWYVLQDSYSHRYFRITPQAYAFIASLTPERTVEESWLDFIAAHPDAAPGQEDVVRVLSQLHVANMLYFKDLPDNQAIYRRSQTQRRRELHSKLMGFLYTRIYLFDPDRMLNGWKGLIALTTSRAAMVVWLLVVLSGAAAAIENWGALSDHSQGLFSLSNLPWLFVSLTSMKLLHELGHAFVCKRFGGEVHAFGVMFLILTPLPYVDTASTWGFKSRFQRAVVSAAGMMVELFLAAIGALIWSHTSTGIVNSLAYNVMVVGSVSSLLFNGNPLLRFDAYYILADLVDIPNLYQKAQQHWMYLGDRYLLGTPGAESPAHNHRERMWFTFYGFGAFCYRILVSTGIILVVMDQWFLVGMFMATVTALTLLIWPLRKLAMHLKGPKVAANRRRAVTTASVLLCGLLVTVLFVPFPYSIRAQGVLQSNGSTMIHTASEALLVRVAVPSGALLKKGDLIAELRNPELDYEYELARQQSVELEMQYRQSLGRSRADAAPIEQRLAALAVQMAEVDRLRALLTVRAPHDGKWVASGSLHERTGNWIPRGQSLGEMVANQSFRFVAVVPQEQADELFRHTDARARLRLAGQSDVTLPIERYALIPYQREKLVSSALGFAGGGETAVKPGDPSGEASAEPFFELRAPLPADLTKAQAAGFDPLPGLSGTLRLDLPGVPLFGQARKALMQLFQKRYGL
jgi:putative peptide zinc metalloprotease protein